MAQIYACGPHGGKLEGQLWDDGFHEGIKEIELYCDENLIHSIRVKYVNEDGEEVWGPKHGGSGGNEHHKVTLDPYEKLTSVITYSSHSRGFEVIKYLEFHTNKNTYGPFGHEEGQKHKFPTSKGYIVGFLGRAGTHLNAIGGNVVDDNN